MRGANWTHIQRYDSWSCFEQGLRGAHCEQKRQHQMSRQPESPNRHNREGSLSACAFRSVYACISCLRDQDNLRLWPSKAESFRRLHYIGVTFAPETVFSTSAERRSAQVWTGQAVIPPAVRPDFGVFSRVLLCGDQIGTLEIGRINPEPSR